MTKTDEILKLLSTYKFDDSLLIGKSHKVDIEINQYIISVQYELGVNVEDLRITNIADSFNELHDYDYTYIKYKLIAMINEQL